MMIRCTDNVKGLWVKRLATTISSISHREPPGVTPTDRVARWCYRARRFAGSFFSSNNPSSRSKSVIPWKSL